MIEPPVAEELIPAPVLLERLLAMDEWAEAVNEVHVRICLTCFWHSHFDVRRLESDYHFRACKGCEWCVRNSAEAARNLSID